MRQSTLVASVVIASLLGARLEAQHLDRHGDHFDLHQNVPHGHDRAGHLIDGFGHHIDGHGNHTGRTGVFEDGTRDYLSHERPYGFDNYLSYPSHRSYSLNYGRSSLYDYRNPYGYGNYGSLRYYSSPSTSYYSNRLYTNPSYYNYRGYSDSIYTNPGYLNPGYGGQLRASDIDIIASLQANQLLATQNPNTIATRSLGGTAVITNPQTNQGEIQYALNSFKYTIKPGEAQTVQLDREWIIQFDNGLNQQVRYRLEDGKFEFVVSPTDGWDIVKRVQKANAAASVESDLPPSLPSNTIPAN